MANTEVIDAMCNFLNEVNSIDVDKACLAVGLAWVSIKSEIVNVSNSVQLRDNTKIQLVKN